MQPSGLLCLTGASLGTACVVGDSINAPALFMSALFSCAFTETTFTGFAVSTPFFRGLLDKLGIRAQFYAREEYKSAAAIYTDHGYTPANKEATKELVDDFMTRTLRDCVM